MAKMKKRPAKKKTAKAATKRSAKKAARKPVSKMTAQKPAPKKKAVGTSVPAKPGPAMKKTGVDEEPRKTSLSKPAPAIIPKGPDLEEEGMGEGEIEEEIEEELPLDGDEEDVDYLEKSEDLLDDSDEFRH